LCHEIGRLYEPGLVYICGIAVYLHAVNAERVRELSEATQDAAFYISVAGFSDLHDIEELSANSRLSKHEFRKGGFSFDLYTERHSKLPVPYANVAEYAQSYDGVLVAAQSEKTCKPFDTNKACAFMRQGHFEMLVEVMKSPEFAGLALGNTQLTKRMRATCAGVMSNIEAAFAAP